MIRNKHGIICSANVPRKKIALTATKKDVGEYVKNVPKYMFELERWHSDLQAREITLTPFPDEMRQLIREGFEFVQTHECKAGAHYIAKAGDDE